MLCSTEENPYKVTNIEKYLIIDNLSVEYPISTLCRVLNINDRSFRKWRSSGKPIANNFNENIADVIAKAFNENYGVYGVNRLKAYIKINEGLNLNHKMIRRYKSILNLKTIVRTKNKTSIKNTKPCNLNYMAENILNCDFSSKAPYEKLSTDVSHIKCSDGQLYLSAVKDLFNNEIISHFVSEKNDTALAINTISNISVFTNNTIMHSDQGSLYYSWEYRNKLKELNVTRSMSERGKCWQNSPIENWFSQLKEEWLKRLGLLSKEDTKIEIKKYVDWYNNQRIQKDLGYLTPIHFKTKYFAFNLAELDRE